jgi:hypothetical protein
MSDYYVKLDLDIDFETHHDTLRNLGKKSNNELLDPYELMSIVTDLKDLNDVFNSRGLSIHAPWLLTGNPHSWNRIHEDADWDNRYYGMNLNFMVKNSASMISRWYNTDGIDHPDLIFKREHLSGGDHDRWWKNNREYLVTERCIESMKMDRHCLFRNDVPHNCDGVESEVSRTIITSRILLQSENRNLQWSEKQLVIDIIDDYQRHKSSVTSQ